jgi:hypothetical protein
MINKPAADGSRALGGLRRLGFKCRATAPGYRSAIMPPDDMEDFGLLAPQISSQKMIGTSPNSRIPAIESVPQGRLRNIKRRRALPFW